MAFNMVRYGYSTEGRKELLEKFALYLGDCIYDCVETDGEQLMDVTGEERMKQAVEDYLLFLEEEDD